MEKSIEPKKEQKQEVDLRLKKNMIGSEVQNEKQV